MKIIDAAVAAKMIEDNMVVYVGGFGAYSGVDELMHGLAERKRTEGHPENLTVLSGICSGYANMDEIGHNILCEPGLTGTIIAGHFMISGKMSRMVSENKVAAYAVPLGAIPGMLRAGASGQPGMLTKVGLGTYVDPEVAGCAVNEKAKEQVAAAAAAAGASQADDSQADAAAKRIGPALITHMDLNGEDYLFYRALKPEACMIRGTFADENGNISLKREGLHEYQLEAAMAAKNNGGIVIVQVEEMVSNGEIPPKEVRIPGLLVDYVVVGAPENSRQVYTKDYRPEISAEAKVDAGDIQPMPLDVRKVIARRAAMELPLKDDPAKKTVAGTDDMLCTDKDSGKCVVNLGIGLPAGVGIVAAEDDLAADMTLSLETGPIGGVPLDGAAFAGAVNHEALMNAPDVFSFYDGGGLDMAFLGAAEVDSTGNVNVSMFGTRCAGPGGFINITQNTPRVCFMGTFMAGRQDIRVQDGELAIVSDGDSAKFVSEVQQITFSGNYAAKTGQEVLYVTERAVFRLASQDADGEADTVSCSADAAREADAAGCGAETGNTASGCTLELIEIAPGIDLERDIISKMGFKPLVSPELKVMPDRIFR